MQKHRGVFVALVGAVGQHELREVVHGKIVTLSQRQAGEVRSTVLFPPLKRSWGGALPAMTIQW